MALGSESRVFLPHGGGKPLRQAQAVSPSHVPTPQDPEHLATLPLSWPSPFPKALWKNAKVGGLCKVRDLRVAAAAWIQH